MIRSVSQVIRRFLGVSNTIRSDKTWHNWGDNYQCQPARYFEPADYDTLIQIVSEARSAGKGLRVVGSGHSWSNIVCTNDYLVNLKHINALINLDKEGRTITVQAGMRVADLVDILDAAGLALFNIGEVDAQHVGGVIATATHGSGNTGSFASMVLSVKLLLSSGEIISISEAENVQYLDAVRTNLGCLGVVLEATLAVRDAFNMIKYEKILPTKTAIENAERYLSLDNLNAKNKIFFFPYGEQHVYATKEEEISAPTTVDRLRNPTLAMVDRLTLSFVMNAGKTVPIALKPFFLNATMKAIDTTRYQIGKSFQLLEFAHDPLFKAVAGHIESEIAIPINKTEEAVSALFDMMKNKTFKINGYVLARTVAKESAWLSPAYDQASVFLTFAHFRTRSEDWKQTFAEIETFMIKNFNGRPHWGKINFTDQQYAEKAYPKYQAFAQVRKELDPIGMFANDFVRRHFVIDNDVMNSKPIAPSKTDMTNTIPLKFQEASGR